MRWRSTSKRWWSSRTTRTGEVAFGGRLPALRCGSSAVVRAFERPDVAFHRTTQRSARIGGYPAPPPGAVDRIEPVRLDGRRNPSHRARRQRDVVREAAHEADVAVVKRQRDYIARQQRTANLVQVRQERVCAAGTKAHK